MRLSTHIKHCCQMLEKFGDKEVELNEHLLLCDEHYVNSPRIDHENGKFEIKPALKEQF